MKPDFSDAMRAVAKLTRTQKLVEATQLIQATLRGKQLAPVQEGAAGSPTAEKGTRFRKPLGEVISTLRRAKERLEKPPSRRSKTLPVPEGAQFLSGSFSCPAGNRDYRLYVPRNHEGALRPLLVMLHGCKQDPVDFALGTRMNDIAEEHGMFVLYPAQAAGANPMSCWNWFTPKDQIRESGEPSILSGITRHVMGNYNIDPDRVFVAGLSAGGAMAAVLGATYLDLYAGIGVHSGLPYQAANDVVSAFAAMRGEATGTLSSRSTPRIRMIVFHGDADQTVHPSNAARIIEAQAQTGDAVEVERSPDRMYTRKITRDLGGKVWNEYWLVHGVRHGWSGGSSEGSFTDPKGPDASREMARFFLEMPR
jgi:poly(hydroxyalkanoate) depolymerase family esterase